LSWKLVRETWRDIGPPPQAGQTVGGESVTFCMISMRWPQAWQANS
jgi:hypothetical protein